MNENTNADNGSDTQADYYTVKQLEEGTGGWKNYPGFTELEAPLPLEDFARITSPDLECGTYALTGMEGTVMSEGGWLWTVVKKERGEGDTIPISKKTARAAIHAFDVLAEDEGVEDPDSDLSDLLDARDELVFNLVGRQE